MRERKKILWLVSWYPNKYDPFDGDFIQRHARAAALYDDVHVLFIKQSEAQKALEKVCSGGEGLTEEIIYLPKERGLPGKLRNFLQWMAVYKKEAGLLEQQNRPLWVHVHIPWKAGLVALWLKKKFKVPFIVTEHWGLYNNVVADNIHTKPFFFRHFLKKVFREASAFVSVSRFLGEGVNQTLLKKPFAVIPNVVDTSLFFPANVKNQRFTFLHVSNMVPLKNVQGILSAFHDFRKQTGADAQLILVGNRDDGCIRFAEDLGLSGTTVFFRGEIPYSEVAKEMQRAHVLILNSDMENSPCVIGEALCCGLPVIATKVGGIPELLSPGNSILIPSRNEAALADAMAMMYANYPHYKTQEIAAAARQTFSFQVIGEIHHKLYDLGLSGK